MKIYEILNEGDLKIKNSVFKMIEKKTATYIDSYLTRWEEMPLSEWGDLSSVPELKKLSPDTPTLWWEDGEGGFEFALFIVAGPDKYYIGDDDVGKRREQVNKIFDKKDEFNMIQYVVKCLEAQYG